MTRTGRFVVVVGSTVIGLAVGALFSALWQALVTDPSWILTLAASVVALALFGVTTGACYTWAVDGPFVRTRRRAR